MFRRRIYVIKSVEYPHPSYSNRQIKPRALEESLFGETEESGLPEKMPERYVRIALDAYLMGKITVSRLAELLNKDVFELRKALAESGLKRSRGAVEKHPA